MSELYKKFMKFTKRINLEEESVDWNLLFFLVINSFFNIVDGFFPGITNTFPNGILLILKLCLLFVPIWKNIKKVNLLSIIILIIILILGLISSFSTENLAMIKQIFINGETISMIIAFVYLAMCKDFYKLFHTFYLASYFVLISSFICIANGFYGQWAEFRYMEFSHSTIVYWSIITLQAFKTKKRVDVIASCLSGIVIGLLGNRAILLNIMISIVIFSNLYFSKKNKVRFNKLLSVGVLILIIFIKPIAFILSKVLAIFNVNSYSLITLNLGDFFSSSSRIEIWENCVDLIFKSPFIGNGIGADRVLTNSVGGYAHNFFLELWVDFGLIFGSIFAVLFVIGCIVLLKKKIAEEVFVPYFLNATIILMLSKSFYILPEFWICLALLCTYFDDKFIAFLKRIKSKVKVSLK